MSSKEPYAKVEVSYLTGFAPSMRRLSLGARVVYLGLWGLCRLHRRQTIEIAGYPKWNDLAADLHIDPRTLRLSIVELSERSLISVTSMQHKGRKFVGLFVAGFRLKHETLKCEDDFQGDNTLQYTTVKERALSPSATMVQEKLKTETQTVAGKRLEAILAFWQSRFGTTLDFGQAGMIVKHCRRKGDSPIRFLSKITADHPAPWEMACGFLQDTYAWPEMQDGQDTFQDWAGSFERKAV